jgi:recombination directionality factor gp3-like protein
MGNRISTIQRQARELGRLRTGVFNGKYPERSKTWIVTSPAAHQVEAAAALFGGKPEKWQPQGSGAAQFRVITEASSIEAIMPPGDPLSQDYESWSKGGVQRRCDGITESLSDSPCLCRATWGDSFHLTAPRDAACKITTRLNVILPQMPDMGVFRVESHSFYAANEIAAAVDMIRAAVGPTRLVPVSLRIEPRTRVSGGETKKFPVIIVELRGATAGEILAATMNANGELAGERTAVGGQGAAVGGSQARAAIGPARPDYVALAKDATTADEVTGIWNQALAAGHLDDELKAKLAPIGVALREAANTSEEAQAGEASAEAEVPEPADEDEMDRLWSLILENAPDHWDSRRVEVEFAARNNNVLPKDATEVQMGAFLQWLQNGGAQ